MLNKRRSSNTDPKELAIIFVEYFKLSDSCSHGFIMTLVYYEAYHEIQMGARTKTNGKVADGGS